MKFNILPIAMMCVISTAIFAQEPSPALKERMETAQTKDQQVQQEKATKLEHAEIALNYFADIKKVLGLEKNSDILPAITTLKKERDDAKAYGRKYYYKYKDLQEKQNEDVDKDLIIRQSGIKARELVDILDPQEPETQTDDIQENAIYIGLTPDSSGNSQTQSNVLIQNQIGNGPELVDKKEPKIEEKPKKKGFWRNLGEKMNILKKKE